MRNKTQVALSTLLVLLLSVFTVMVQASPDEQGSGYLLLTPNSGGEPFQALMLDAEAEINVTAMTAQVTLRQTFVNTTQDWVNGTYVFPLPETAAVSGLTLKIGERIIKGEIHERAQAKKVYEQAKAQGKQASLLESDRPNLFTLSLANIEAGGEVSAEISYLQTVTYSQGSFSMRLPTTFTPRYSLASGIKKGVTTSPQTTLRSVDTQNLNPIRIHVNINPGVKLVDINSASDAIDWMEFGGTYEVTLQNDSMPMDHDFLLGWQVAEQDQPDAVLFSEEVEGDWFTTLMVMPPQTLSTESIPRELIYIIDSSGSMQGASMRQARASLLHALDSLSAEDHFNIIDFDDEADALFDQAQIADNLRVSEAIEFVNGLSADGGTNMVSALALALAGSPAEGYLRQVVFITDGSVSNESELFKLIHQELKQTRLFTVGIGSAPNSYFMRKAAEFGRGSFTYISDIADVQQKMTQLFHQLESPVLRDIQIRWPNGSDAEAFPHPIPDLYLGEPLVISTRIKPVSGEVTIKGELNSAPWQRTLSINQPSGYSGLSTLWAKRKIEWLMDKKVTGTPENEVRPAVIDIALKHQLATQYTSFVAVEQIQVRAEDEVSSDHRVASLMPKGRSMALAFPKTATSAELGFYWGLLLISLAGIYGWILIRKSKA